MNAIWAVAVITFKEGIRNRAIYGICLLALLLFGADFFVAGMVMRDVGKVAVDIALSTVSLAGLLVVFFVGINLMAKDLDRKTIYVVLSRPISRASYIIGKFAGVILLLAMAFSVLIPAAGAALLSLKGMYSTFFPDFSWGLVLLSCCLTFLGLCMLTGLSFLFYSFSSNSFVTLILTLVSYLIGISINDIRALLGMADVVGITVSRPASLLIEGVFYVFPNLALFDIKAQAAHGVAIASAQVLFTSLYGIVYTLITVTLAAFIFRSREFP